MSKQLIEPSQTIIWLRALYSTIRGYENYFIDKINTILFLQTPITNWIVKISLGKTLLKLNSEITIKRIKNEFINDRKKYYIIFYHIN